MAKEGDALPLVARDTRGNITAVSIERSLQRFMKQKVALRNLKGLRPVTVNESLIAQQMAAAIAGLTVVTIKADERNKRKREEANEDKDIESLFSGSKYDTLGYFVQVPPGESLGNAAPILWSDLANKKKNNSIHSIFHQSVRDSGKTLKIKAPIIPFSVVTYLINGTDVGRI